jgi:hypothetical protein
VHHIVHHSCITSCITPRDDWPLHRTAPLAPFPGPLPLAPFPGQADGTPMPTLLYGYGSYGICIEPEFSGKL